MAYQLFFSDFLATVRTTTTHSRPAIWLLPRPNAVALKRSLQKRPQSEWMKNVGVSNGKKKFVPSFIFFVFFLFFFVFLVCVSQIFYDGRRSVAAKAAPSFALLPLRNFTTDSLNGSHHVFFFLFLFFFFLVNGLIRSFFYRVSASAAGRYRVEFLFGCCCCCFIGNFFFGELLYLFFIFFTSFWRMVFLEGRWLVGPPGHLRKKKRRTGSGGIKCRIFKKKKKR